MAAGRRSVTNTKEELLDLKRKKRWRDEKSGQYGIMIYPRALYVTWGHREYWDWKCFKETSDENIEVARLSHACWLDVRGKLKMSELSPGASYEVVYKVKLTKSASGWELPITLRLSLPGKSHERRESLLEKPRGEWFDLKVGKFQTPSHSDGDCNGTEEVCFDIFEHGGHWKQGLLIEGAIVRPSN